MPTIIPWGAGGTQPPLGQYYADEVWQTWITSSTTMTTNVVPTMSNATVYTQTSTGNAVYNYNSVPVENEEQFLAREAERVAFQARQARDRELLAQRQARLAENAAKRSLERQAAHDRGLQLVEMVLSPEEREQWREEFCVDLHKEGYSYRVWGSPEWNRGSVSGNITIYQGNNYSSAQCQGDVVGLCVHPNMYADQRDEQGNPIYLPNSDGWACQIIAIKSDEDHLLAVANPDSYLPWYREIRDAARVRRRGTSRERYAERARRQRAIYRATHPLEPQPRVNGRFAPRTLVQDVEQAWDEAHDEYDARDVESRRAAMAREMRRQMRRHGNQIVAA